MADKNILVLCYSRCTTCKRALKWLDEHGVSYTLRDIKEENPTAEELAEWHKLSGLSIRKFFNTSGMVYRDNNIKEQLDAGMSDSDAYNLLATTGMLVKR
ncbi:MAG: arsenate reductase family protein, partial [Atopobium sp.]|nr:arsenate reductase family protein [Atopobium sp.]